MAGEFSPPDDGKAASPAHPAARLPAPDRSAGLCAAGSATPPSALRPAANPRKP